MKLGANSILFGGHNMETAFQYIAMAGYDGIEVSAVDGHSEHLVLDNWREIAPKVKQLSADYGLDLLAMEQSNRDPIRMEAAMQAAVEIGIPTINCGPGGKMDDEDSFLETVDAIGELAKMAEKYGVTLCIKAHVGHSVYNTATSLRLMEAIASPALGINLDPSHIHRANENPIDIVPDVIAYVKNVHIRDCKGRQQGPGKPEDQANGRGDVDLVGFVRVLHQQGYTGPLNLEVIGAKAYSVEQCCIIAAETRGHMQACLQACGARR